MSNKPFRRLMSLIPPRPPSPPNRTYDYETIQPKLQIKHFQLEDLPLLLNRQHLPVMSFVPQRLKTEIYRKCQPQQHKKINNERYHTIDRSDTRKISIENSHKLRKLNYSYDVRRRRSSLKNFNFEQNFMVFARNQNLNKIRITKQEILEKASLRYNHQISNRMISFFEIPQIVDFPFWKSLMQKLFFLNQEQKMVVIYRLLHNKKIISSSDLFELQLNVQSEAIHKDVKVILNYIKSSLNKETIDDEEIEFLKKSSIFTECLRISHLLTWTEIYQVDVRVQLLQQNISVKKNKVSYKRAVPLENFITNYLSSGKEDKIPQRYPTHFTENEPFSITFPIFRKIFSSKQMNFWLDIVAFFCGLP